MMQLKFRAIIWLVAKSENAKGWKKQKKKLWNWLRMTKGSTAARAEKEESAI